MAAHLASHGTKMLGIRSKVYTSLVRARPVWRTGGGHAISTRGFTSKAPDNSFDVTELDKIPQENIRNFCIIAHVDHGKSTLADRLLELTGNISPGGGQDQVLDSLAVERERGITVKAQTASMIYRHPETNKAYLLNLIDTPGHVDFSFEVSRSLGACQGALLLVDSTQGIQAQTLANHRIAEKANLKIVPCLTKMDLRHSDPDRTIQQIESTLLYDEEEILWTSAKTGEGVEHLLESIVDTMPPPSGSRDAKLRALIADSWYNKYRGVICLVSVVDGSIAQGEPLAVASSRKKFEVQEVGVLTPKPMPVKRLVAGQVGYVIAGIKDISEAPVGDTLFDGSAGDVELLQSFEKVKPMLFSSIFPIDAADFDELRDSIGFLLLNDGSVSCHMDANTALGQGFRCGFLGKLHMEVFLQRLQDEYGQEILATAPAVPYIAVLKDGSEMVAQIASQLPDSHKVTEYREPMARVTVVVPPEYMGSVLKLLNERRGVEEEISHLDEHTVMFRYKMPWQEVIIDLYDEIKWATSGRASFDYEEADYERSDIARIDIMINGDVIDPLSFVCHKTVAVARARQVARKLKQVIRNQLFQVNIQACINKKIIARETISALRKNVLEKSGKVVGGGDETRKKKLLEKQKRGKERLKSVGKIQLDQQAFMAVLASSSSGKN